MDISKVIEIEKEEIVDCHFPSEEVLISVDQKKARTDALKKGETLGNLEHLKIKIIFEDDQSFKKVVTTIWAVGDTSIVLKKGVVIPIHRIHEIRVY
ncbi:MAG: hypothetical protein ACJAY8_000538 [Sphingobacteriales bacterium]|jgi:uncharacterized protein (UPF0248 family)